MSIRSNKLLIVPILKLSFVNTGQTSRVCNQRNHTWPHTQKAAHRWGLMLCSQHSELFILSLNLCFIKTVWWDSAEDIPRAKVLALVCFYHPLPPATTRRGSPLLAPLTHNNYCHLCPPQEPRQGTSLSAYALEASTSALQANLVVKILSFSKHL